MDSDFKRRLEAAEARAASARANATQRIKEISIPAEELVYRRLYRIAARNFGVGLWVPPGTQMRERVQTFGGFIGPREKFGEWFPFVEYDYISEGGSAYAIEDLGIDLPDEIEAVDIFWDEPGPGYFAYNTALLDWLRDQENQVDV